jgi:hypothetical protein
MGVENAETRTKKNKKNVAQRARREKGGMTMTTIVFSLSKTKKRTP